jgi:hypothetical protein
MFLTGSVTWVSELGQKGNHTETRAFTPHGFYYPFQVFSGLDIDVRRASKPISNRAETTAVNCSNIPDAKLCLLDSGLEV